MKLKAAWNDYRTNGIFHNLDVFNPPWKDSFTPTELDINYMMLHGAKETSYFVDSLEEKEDVVLQQSTKDAVAFTIRDLFFDKWAKTWEVLHANYNPISNYDMIEEENSTNEESGTSSRNTNSSSTSNSSSESDTTGSNTSNTESDESSKIFGFDSESGVDNDARNSQSNDSNESQSHTDSSSESTVSGEATETGSTTNNGNTNRRLTRSGNIGVTTSQQMIEAEMKLREYNYMKVVFADINSILTCNVYRGC